MGEWTILIWVSKDLSVAYLPLPWLSLFFRQTTLDVGNHHLRFTLRDHSLFHLSLSLWCNLSASKSSALMVLFNFARGLTTVLFIEIVLIYLTLWLLWPCFVKVQIIKMRMSMILTPSWPRHNVLKTCYFNGRHITIDREISHKNKAPCTLCRKGLDMGIVEKRMWSHVWRLNLTSLGWDR